MKRSLPTCFGLLMNQPLQRCIHIGLNCPKTQGGGPEIPDMYQGEPFGQGGPPAPPLCPTQSAPRQRRSPGARGGCSLGDGGRPRRGTTGHSLSREKRSPWGHGPTPHCVNTTDGSGLSCNGNKKPRRSGVSLDSWDDLVGSSPARQHMGSRQRRDTGA